MNGQDLGNYQMNVSTELRYKFFFHWSLLAGATLTLIIPLLMEILKKDSLLYHVANVKIAIVLLISSLCFSSLRNYLASIGIWITAMTNLQGGGVIPLKRILLSRIQYVIEILSITSYLVALILLFVFINSNIF